MTRAAGVLLHPTSLPGPGGIGSLGEPAFAFLDWVQSAGLRMWQVLPLNPPGYGNSPYGCLSSYAGNPLLISLPSDDVPSEDHVDFNRVREVKHAALRQSFAQFRAGEDRAALTAFERDNAWLPDWALFAALKEQHGDRAWTEWPPELAFRDKEAIARARRELADEIRFHKYVQWLFFTQWAAVRRAAAARGITIMGDVPIYVAWDSADVWANRHLFQLDDEGRPTVVAGVPPDYFSETGQRWGNPLYRWDTLRETRFRWWVSRIRAALRFADVVRMDHFRGFAAYWEIPAQEPTAIHGRWVPAPGKALFDAIRNALGGLPLVAEDLGHITEEVHALRRVIGIPGMRVLQFAFQQPDSPHLPHCYAPETVVYTGTHDNDTARGWFENASEEERAAVATYLGLDDVDDAAWTLIRAAFTSVAQTAIVPVQDILDLGSEGRMNMPGDEKGNWTWRLREGALTAHHAGRVRGLVEVSGRAP
ncbi:MAG TPA: 4-alpha-glucanotransferase [Thermoanaerobaculia bacterium]|nr:4-alpha-glucanotransferase [Thermoanaerobaculia bacterium]